MIPERALFIFGDHRTVFVIGECDQTSFFIWNFPVAGQNAALLVVNTDAALTFSLIEKLNFMSIGKTADLNQLSLVEIPVR